MINIVCRVAKEVARCYALSKTNARHTKEILRLDAEERATRPSDARKSNGGGKAPGP
jgi:hypothetical protein